MVQLSECRKKHSFYSQKRKHSGCQWRVEAVAGAVGPAISGSCSTDSTSRKTRQMLQIFQKLQCLTDPSILTMIYKRFIYVLTRNWSNDNPFLVYNRPFQLSTFPATASVSASVTPAHSEVGAPEGKLEIAAICNGAPKQTFDFFAHCILPTIVNILELSFLVSFYTVKYVSFTRCKPRSGYFRIPFDPFS